MARSPICGTVQIHRIAVRDRAGGIVNVGLPLNVSGRADVGWISESLSRSARWAAPIASGAVPYRSPNTTRALEPPMLVCTIWRNVWLEKCTNAGAGEAPAGTGWA